jgi:hypothetical protein
MDLPDIVREALGDESPEAGVRVGGEDVLCVTPTRTLLYRAEGLLSDESVAEFPHDVERLRVADSRRKTKFVLEYVDDKRDFAVPADKGDRVLELLMGGVLRAAGVTADGESVVGVYRFSELTLVVTERHVVRHIGSVVWDADYEAYAYDDVTRLDFEAGSHATAVVLEIDGRPERIKAPNDKAKLLRRDLEGALFAFHDVDSLEALNAAVAPETKTVGGDDEASDDADNRDLSLDSGIDPLVSGDEAAEDKATDETDERSPDADGFAPKDGGTGTGGSAPSAEAPWPDEGADGADFEALQAEIADLRAAVEAQGERIEEQQRVIQQLIEELKAGR